MEPPLARIPPKQKIIINENKNNELITGNNNHASHFVPTEREIRNFAKITHPHAVTTYLDKNGGAGIVMCKKHHYNINKKTFNDDIDHYDHIEVNEFEIMDKFQKFHSKHKLQHIKKNFTFQLESEDHQTSLSVRHNRT